MKLIDFAMRRKGHAMSPINNAHAPMTANMAIYAKPRNTGIKKTKAAISTMRRLYTLFALLSIGSLACADTLTNRIGLTEPTCGSQNWCNQINSNWAIIDSTINTSGGGGGGSYINNQSTLQSGATFYVSSGTVSTLNTSTITANTYFGMPYSILSNDLELYRVTGLGYSQILYTGKYGSDFAITNGQTRPSGSPPNLQGNAFMDFNGNYNPSTMMIGTDGSTITLKNFDLVGTPATININTSVLNINATVNSSSTWTGQQNWTSASPSTFTALAVGSLSMTGSGNMSVTEPNGVSGQVVLSTTTPTNGQCGIWSSSMTLISGACGTGGGGSGSGTVNLGTQYQVPYYSASGSSNTLSGAPNFTNDGSTITIASTNTIIANISTMTQTNVSTVTATGVYFDYTGSIQTVTSLTVSTFTVKGVTFSTLGNAAPNGTYKYCSDCTVVTPTTCTMNLLTSCVCAGSGSGAFAKRLNGSWYCQ